MALNTQEAVRNMISYTIVTDKDSIVRLLERNGVQMPNNPTDKDVTAAVLLASVSSQNFKNELTSLLTTKVSKAGDDFASFAADNSDFGFTGIDDFSADGGNGFVNKVGDKAAARAAKKTARIKEVNPQGKSGIGIFLRNLGSSLTSPDTLNAGLNVGLTALNNKFQTRQNTLQQETALLTERQDQIRQDLSTSGKSGGMRFPTWAFVVLGLAVVGGIVFAVTRKK